MSEGAGATSRHKPAAASTTSRPGPPEVGASTGAIVSPTSAVTVAAAPSRSASRS